MYSSLIGVAAWLPSKLLPKPARRAHVRAGSADPAKFRTIWRNGAMRRFAIWALVNGLLALSTIAQAADAPLSLVEAQRLAAERSRQLTAQDSAVSASREMAVSVGQLPDPMLQLGIDNLPINGADRFSLTRDFMTMRRLGVMQEFTREEKRQLRAERFEREAERGLAERTATLASIQRDTALAWLDRYYAEAAAAIVSDQIREARLEIEAAENAYRSGKGSQADVYAARSALVALEDRASETGRRIRNASTALARWIGRAAEAPLASKPDIDRVRLDTRSLDEQLAHHPQISVLDRQEEIARTEVRLAEANKKTDWSVELMFSQRGPAYSNMVSVGVSIPLQWDQKNRQDRELAAKLAMAEQARAQREEALRAHIAEVRTMLNEWENGRERRARYEHELIPLAKRRTEAALSAYRGGKTNLPDVLMARRHEIDVRMQLLQFEAETARLWAQINFLFPEGAVPHTGAVTHRFMNPTSATR
jgi:outer membrane protein TolC